MYLFISHSSKDAATAQELCHLLEANGFRCFLSSRDIQPGQEYATELINAIDRSDAVLLLLSRHAQSSPHVLREVERSVSKSVPILVYKLEDVVLTKSFEYFLLSHQWLDAECCRYEKLLRCIQDIEKNSKKRNKKHWVPLLLSLAIILSLGSTLGIVFSNARKEDATLSDDSFTESKSVNVQPGDSILLGTYNDAPIEWNVLTVSADGTEALLVSKYILSFKAFDGADSGNYGFSENTAAMLGSNCWDTSAIRTWLNSEKDYVQYEGAAPSDLAMSDHCNGYDLEAGFLRGFSKEELNSIKETTIETTAGTISDRVFLLSRNELDFFDTAGVSLLAIPTKEAIAANESSFYTEYCQGVFKTDASIWWLRDAVENSATEGYQVNHGATGSETLCSSAACADGYGIRPAITLDLTSDYVVQQQMKKK